MYVIESSTCFLVCRNTGSGTGVTQAWEGCFLAVSTNVAYSWKGLQNLINCSCKGTGIGSVVVPYSKFGPLSRLM